MSVFSGERWCEDDSPAAQYSARLASPLTRDVPAQLDNDQPLSSLRYSAIYREQATKVPLLLEVRKVQVLAFVVVLIAVMLVVIGVFATGVRIKTITRTAMNEDEKNRFLSDYNFYTGTMAAIAAKGFEMCVSLFLPVLSLVVLPRVTVRGDSMTWAAILVVLESLFIALLTSAFSSLNVQLISELYTPVIVDVDLFAIEIESHANLSIFNASSTVQPQPAIDTILRTALQPPFIKDSSDGLSSCTGYDQWANIAMMYGFFPNYWIKDVLPDGREPTYAVTRKLRDIGTGNENEPVFDELLVGLLLTQSLVVSERILSWNALSAQTNGPFDQFMNELSRLPNMNNSTKAQKMDSFWIIAGAMLNESLSYHSNLQGLNFDLDNVSLTVSRVDISADIVFDGVVIDIPFDEAAIAGKGAFGSGSDRLYGLQSYQNCGEDACLVSPPVLGEAAVLIENRSQWDAQPQIQAFAACEYAKDTDIASQAYLRGEYCSEKSNSTMLIYGFGRRIEADSITVSDTNSSADGDMVVNVHNMQRHHTITFGRLSWKANDLATHFNAHCGRDSGDGSCLGLSYPLDDGSTSSARRFLVVGEQYLPLASLEQFKGRGTQWTPLLMLALPSSTAGDMIYARNLRYRSEAAWEIVRTECSKTIDSVAARVDRNHWYMDFGLQESYTAALLFLFQNAAVHEETNRTDNLRTLNFRGNIESVTMEARVPLQSALVSGSGGLLLLGAAFLVVILGRKRMPTIQSEIGVQEVAKVLLVEDQYPRVFLNCLLDNPYDRIRRPIDEFRIEAIALRRALDPAGQDLDDSEPITVRVPVPPLPPPSQLH